MICNIWLFWRGGGGGSGRQNQHSSCLAVCKVTLVGWFCLFLQSVGAAFLYSILSVLHTEIPALRVMQLEVEQCGAVVRTWAQGSDPQS